MSTRPPRSAESIGESVSRQHLLQWKRGMAASAVLAVLSLAAMLLERDAARSALLAVSVIALLFSFSSLVLAAAAKRNPNGVVLLGLGLYVLKVFVIAMLLLSAPRPGWLQPIPAAAAAIAAVLAWQWALISASRRSRIPLYAPDPATGLEAAPQSEAPASEKKG